MSQGPLQQTSKLKRFINYILDVIVYLVFCFVLGIILGIVLALSGNLDFIESAEFERWGNIIGIIVLFLYYFIFEVSFGATPAKFITGTRVYTRQGMKPSTKAIALRSLIRFVPFEPFSFLFGEGWHDKWSKTIVSELKQAEASPGQ